MILATKTLNGIALGMYRLDKPRLVVEIVLIEDADDALTQRTGLKADST